MPTLRSSLNKEDLWPPRHHLHMWDVSQESQGYQWGSRERSTTGTAVLMGEVGDSNQAFTKNLYSQASCACGGWWWWWWRDQGNPAYPEASPLPTGYFCKANNRKIGAVSRVAEIGSRQCKAWIFQLHFLLLLRSFWAEVAEREQDPPRQL